MSNLYIVATPIGNLEDITKRALRILSEVDLILCEDTRETKKLLDHYNIKTDTFSYHRYSSPKEVEQIIGFLKKDKSLALVSDAGTPGISDPGSKLIEKVAQEMKEVLIIPVPGSSALAAAASVSGFPISKFVFLGFPPVKKGRKNFFKEVINSKYPVIFYESPYRILKSLAELAELKKSLQIVVCREITKKFETIYRGQINQVLDTLKKGETKGEFVVVVNS